MYSTASITGTGNGLPESPAAETIVLRYREKEGHDKDSDGITAKKVSPTMVEMSNYDPGGNLTSRRNYK